MQEIDYREAMAEITRHLASGGVFLTTQRNEDAPPNTMTIGWAQMGYIWKKPIFMALVRPQRHTYSLIEESGEFTVSVPTDGLQKALGYAGSHSGRTEDKFLGHGLTAMPAQKLMTPVIKECALHLECRVVMKQDMQSQMMAPELCSAWYPQSDLHRMYFSEILSCYRTT